MPYIDNTPALSPYKLREGELQNGFVGLLIKHGWKKALEFKKAVTSQHFVSDHPDTARHNETFIVANHIIMRNARGNLLGVVTTAEWTDYTAHNAGMPYYNVFNSDGSDLNGLKKYLKESFEQHHSNTTIYFYMLDKLPNISDDSVIVTSWNDPETTSTTQEGAGAKPSRQMALDVEVTETGFHSVDHKSVYVKTAEPYVMQSPIVETVLRSPKLDKVNQPYFETNWWKDSEVSIRGNIDSNNFFLIVQTDNTPMWEGNAVPVIPIYFGDFIPEDEGDPGIALFAGTTVDAATLNDVAKFDVTNTKIKGNKRYLPILKTYPSHPSDGINSVMVNRTKLGARYQNYFLSWNTASHQMPPSRTNDAGDRHYPRAWENLTKYQVNPSRYSGKVQTSRIYLVHPEEGVRGYLKSAVGLNSININSSELRIRKEDCPEKVFDVYQCIPVSALSPLTKRPATVHSPIGIALYVNELNVANPFVVDKTSSKPIAEVSSLSAEDLGQGRVLVSWKNPNDRNLKHVNIVVNGEEVATGVVDVDEYLIELEGGDYTIAVMTVSQAGVESEGVTTSVEVN